MQKCYSKVYVEKPFFIASLMRKRPWQKRSPDAPGETVNISARVPSSYLEDLKSFSGTISYNVRKAVELYVEAKKSDQE
jgi:hypothetical protein